MAIWPIGFSAPQGSPDSGPGGNGDSEPAEAGSTPAANPPARKAAPKQSVPAEQVELLEEVAASATVQDRGGKTAANAAPVPLKRVAAEAKKKEEPAAIAPHPGVKAQVTTKASASAPAAPITPSDPADKARADTESKAAPPRKEKASNRPTPAEIARGTRGPAPGKEPVTPRFDFGEEEQAATKNAGGKSQAKKLDVVVSVTKTQAKQSADKTKPAPKKDK